MNDQPFLEQPSIANSQAVGVPGGATPVRQGVGRLLPPGATAQPAAERLEIHVSLAPLMLLLLAAVGIIALASMAVNLAIPTNGDALPIEGHVYRFFDLNEEHNLPSWYQSVALATASALLALVGSAVWRNGVRWIGAYWMVLAAGFLFLSLDEAVVIHEQIIDPIRNALDISSGILFFAWVIPAAAAVAVVGIMFIPFLRQLPTSTRYQFLIAGALYIAGAIGMELIGGAYASSHNVGIESGVYSFRYSLLYTVEEVLEMLGIVLFLGSILQYMATHRGVVSIGSPINGDLRAGD